jgi:hypothetical protein
MRTAPTGDIPMWAFLCIISLIVRSATSQVVFPPDFIGTWTGIPEVSVLGPWTTLFTFHIAADPSGGWFMHDVMNSSDGMTGVQRFYVDGSGFLTYCGALDNFFSSAYNGTVQVCVVWQHILSLCYRGIPKFWTH